uniref:Protein kinase domain-containing protein n=1 Tax=Anopheles epiroticus TaxID=199890 RepID=A0A182PAW5_9DIPT
MEIQAMVKEAVQGYGQKELLTELKTFMQVGHHVNVLNLLGIVIGDMEHGELFVITEYCRFGNLKDFLLKNRQFFRDEDDEDVTESVRLDLLSWSYQIANGLKHLASRDLVHGSLSARNVLLGEGNIVKLSNVAPYCRPQHCKLTPKNILSLERMAPECLQDGGGTFTTSSDVWSFGVLLWELFSLGSDPCWGMIPHGRLVDSFECVRRLPTPKHANEELYQLMRDCWKHDPQERPSFMELCYSLHSMIPGKEVSKRYDL